MKKENFELGQAVYYTLDYRKDQHLFKGEVTKVGTKYVTVNDQYQFNYGKGNLKEFGGQLYLSEQDFKDKVELDKTFSTIRDRFYYAVGYNEKPVTLEQARAILKILEN